MSEYGWNAEGSEFKISSGEVPGLDNIVLATVAIMSASHDPENALMVSITERELCLLVAGVYFLNCLLPDFGGAIAELQLKLEELNQAQEKFGIQKEE